ncbi:MAG: hypothetical protein OEX74_14640, partial [Gammaproteobacteria bacterium]|nr:hypothetical protein [Gammaproteobacteria bacterium]
MTDELSIDEQSLRAAFEQSEQELTRLQDALHSAGDDLAALAAKRYEYVVLSDVCRSLEELDKLGAGDLFWSPQDDSAARDAKLSSAYHKIDAYHAEVSRADERRNS